MIRRATKDDVFTLSNLWAKMSNGLIGSVCDACSPASDAYEEINNLLMNKDIHFVLFEKNQIINGFFLGWIQEKDFYYFKDDYCYIFCYFIEDGYEKESFPDLINYFEKLAIYHNVKTIQIDVYKNLDKILSILELSDFKKYRTRYKKNIQNKMFIGQANNKLQFKCAGINDVNSIKPLWEELVDTQMAGEIFSMDIRNDVLNNGTYKNNMEKGYVEVAIDKSDNVGFIEAELREKDSHFMIDDYVYIINHYLKPYFRNFRTATSMLLRVENWAAKKGYKYSCADVFEHNARVGRCLGYYGYEPFKSRFIKCVD